MQTLPSIEAWWHDLRYALRTLWRSPGFAVVSIVTLGLGIAAATAIFSVIYNVLLAPFPYRDADRMVFPRIYDTQQGPEIGRQGYSAAEVLEFVESNHVFDATTAAHGELVLYRHRDGNRVVRGARVTPGTFEFFGLPALHGRALQPSDYEPGAPPVFVMRHKAWMRALWRRSLDPEPDVDAEWHAPDARRHHAAALWLVRSGRVHSREVDA